MQIQHFVPFPKIVSMYFSLRLFPFVVSFAVSEAIKPKVDTFFLCVDFIILLLLSPVKKKCIGHESNLNRCADARE